MSHFGSEKWPSEYGVVASLTALAVSNIYAGGATTLGSTEGTDLLTYTVPTAGGPTPSGSGFYRITCQIHNLLDSNPQTSHIATVQITYNNGSAVAAVDLGALKGGGINTQAGVDMEVTANQGGQIGVIYAVEGTDITVFTQHIVVGTAPDAGTHNLNFCIERIG